MVINITISLLTFSRSFYSEKLSKTTLAQKQNVTDEMKKMWFKHLFGDAFPVFHDVKDKQAKVT